MLYKVTQTPLAGVLVLEPKVFGDARGFFFESFNQRDFNVATGLNETFVQDNHSKSSKGVLRGLHYQTQHAQGKLVRVTQGAVFDVAVDIRRGSPTFGKWVGAHLSAENKQQLWVPAGFAHGFVTLSDTAEFLYKTTDYYAPTQERSIRWDDPTIGIRWPFEGAPLLAAKDVRNSHIMIVDDDRREALGAGDGEGHVGLDRGLGRAQLGEGLLEYVGPLVETTPQEKPLSIAMREINAGLLVAEPTEG